MDDDELQARPEVAERAHRLPLTPLRHMPAAQGPDPETVQAYPPEPDRPEGEVYLEDVQMPAPALVWPWLGLAVAVALMVVATVLVVTSAISGVPWAVVMGVGGWIVGVVADPRRSARSGP